VFIPLTRENRKIFGNKTVTPRGVKACKASETLP
jgi:hypothetical protein